ncbi:MAG: hypothetical protein WB608_05535, partial [Terracidiphilus sp.]
MLSRTLITPRAQWYTLRARAEAIRALERLRRRSTKERLIVFDPALMGFSGHHIELARIIKTGLSAAFDVRLYANFEAANRIVAELRAQPICHGTLYVQSDDFRAANEQQRLFLTSALRKIDLSLLSPRTIFVMHTVTIYQLAGLAEWYSGLPPAHRPK